MISARGRSQKTHPKLIDLGASSAPKSTPDIPKATQEASRSGWMTTAAKSRGQERPRHASKGFRVPLAGKCDFRRGLRVTGFAHPGPLGTDNYQRKAFNNNSTRDLTRRWAAGPAIFCLWLVSYHFFCFFLRLCQAYLELSGWCVACRPHQKRIRRACGPTACQIPG